MFLNSLENEFGIFCEPVSSITEKDFAECGFHTRISEAASLISQKKSTALLIKDENGNYTGILTDKDFREKVIANSLSSSAAVSKIMSSPLISVHHQSSLFEAIYLMNRENIKHLVVQDDNGKVQGIISDHEIITAQGHSPLHLLREISTVFKPQELYSIHNKLPGIVNHMIRNGAKIEMVNRFITTVSDDILQKVIEYTMQELGPAPAPFAFIVMGSEGRKEQTLKTDQDNAIIYQGSEGNEDDPQNAYFLKFGRSVCLHLDKAGYKLCDGEVMAMNPRWRQPLSAWKQYFNNWINTPEPMALMHSSIFFDFRRGYGDAALVDELKKYLFEQLSGRSDLFFYHMARNAVRSEPLLGLFNKFKLEKSGSHKKSLNIKKAMTPIVDFVRLYALHDQIEATNTINRLHVLHEKGVFSKQAYEDYMQAYNFLMKLRFTHQLGNIINQGAEPGNYIQPKNLSRIEQSMLKEVLKLVKSMKQKMSVKFTAMG